jgi:SAM-dependent methyltransferase
VNDVPPEWEAFGPADALDWWEARHRDHRGLDAVGYAGAGEAYNRWLYRVRQHLFRRHVAPVADATTSVLDVASGTGFYLERWREAGVTDLAGSDVSETAVAELRARFPSLSIDRFDISGPAGELPERRFDVVSAFDVLFHLIDDDDYRRALANLSRLVAPGGLLVISENFRLAGPRRFASVQVNREQDEILALLDENGLEVIERRPMFVVMNAPARGDHPGLQAWWLRVHRQLMARPWIGGPLGAALYPVELACLGTVRRAPSTELVICRRGATQS